MLRDSAPVGAGEREEEEEWCHHVLKSKKMDRMLDETGMMT
jgi:hypothetical protein